MKPIAFIRHLLTMVFLCLFLCVPPLPAFDTAAPEEIGVDSRFLHEMLSLVRTGQMDIHSLLVLKNNKLILEAYVHPYTPDTLHNVKSVSKSILSALVGIAMDRGIFKNMDVTLADAFPEYMAGQADPRKSDVTLAHLLSMQAGFEFIENSRLSSRWMKSGNWVKHAIEMPMADPPGTRFTYSTANSHLVSAWLTRAAGMGTAEFAQKYLFTPLGIHNVTWLKDPRGIDIGGSQVYMRPRDMLKFGRLFLEKGKQGSSRVVPGEWVEESTAEQALSPSGGYGYGWWRTTFDTGYMAAGWAGQRIAVFPQKNLVIVTTSANTGQADFLLKKVTQGIVSTGSPLPDNPGAYQELTALAAALASPLKAPAPMPPDAQRISGIPFELERNPVGLSRIMFDFSGHVTASLSVTTSDDATITLPVGIDGRYKVSGARGFGHSRKENVRTAIQCRWEDNTLITQILPIGEPLRYQANIDFTASRLTGLLNLYPVNTYTLLRGRQVR